MRVLTVGSRQLSNDQKNTRTTSAASTIGSLGSSTGNNNVNLTAGRTYQQTGSDVLALQGDANITAQTVTINEARETQRSSSDTKFKQSGVTLAVTNPVISAVQLAQHMSQAASNTSDPRMQTLAAASTALAAVNAAQALKAGQGQTINGKDNQIVTATDAQGNPTATKDANAADKLGGITVSVSLGSSKSQSHSTQTANQAASSSVAAAGDVTIVAQGAGKNNDKNDTSDKSDILIQGSKLTAGGAVVVQADDQLTLQAAANTADQKSSNSSQSMSVGVGFELGAKGGAGITLAGSLGRGKANGSDLSWEETRVNAGREVALTSGSDTQLKGAIVTAPKVSAEVGGNLNITSLQDTSTYRNKQQSVGGSITFGPKVTGSVNFANSHIKSDYASVDQQAGLRAGDNGFQVNVQGDATLTGGAITSTDKAIAESKNSFTTGGQLTTTDINNQANYQADSVGVNIGVGVSPTGKYVPGGTSAGIGSDSGKSSSTTRAGISDIAGDTTARTNTNQANTSVALAKIFDADKVQKEINAQVAITQSFTYEAGKTVNNYVSAQRKALQDQLMQSSNDADQQKIVKDQLTDLNRQERVMNILIGAVAGMGSAAVAKETLSVAAEEMRKLMIVDSIKFAGVTDGKTILNNDSGSSAGMHGDGKKLGGTRIDLDLLCGSKNQRCTTNPDGSLKINAYGLIEFKPETTNVNSLEEFLLTPDGVKMAGLTGGIQGAKGTLFGVPYQAGSWQDQLVEAFAGTHDMVGGKLSGLYDEQGNATRDRSYIVKKAQDTWSASGAIMVSAPFAMSELLTPEMWKAISVLLKEVK
jgi:filamentous hemagglutinin